MRVFSDRFLQTETTRTPLLMCTAPTALLNSHTKLAGHTHSTVVPLSPPTKSIHLPLAMRRSSRRLRRRQQLHPLHRDELLRRLLELTRRLVLLEVVDAELVVRRLSNPRVGHRRLGGDPFLRVDRQHCAHEVLRLRRGRARQAGA